MNNVQKHEQSKKTILNPSTPYTSCTPTVILKTINHHTRGKGSMHGPLILSNPLFKKNVRGLKYPKQSWKVDTCRNNTRNINPCRLHNKRKHPVHIYVCIYVYKVDVFRKYLRAQAITSGYCLTCHLAQHYVSANDISYQRLLSLAKNLLNIENSLFAILPIIGHTHQDIY